MQFFDLVAEALQKDSGAPISSWTCELLILSSVLYHLANRDVCEYFGH